MNALNQIKRLVIRGSVRFTEKARHEMELSALRVEDVIESILNARKIDKVLRSTSSSRRTTAEKLYVIRSRNFDGTPIYTKGVIAREHEQEVFYVFISAKIQD